MVGIPSRARLREITPRRLKRMRLRTILVLPLLLQLVGAVGLVGWLSFRSGEASVTELADQLHSEMGQRTRDRVTEYLEGAQRVNQVNINALDLGLISLDNIGAARSYFWRQALTYPFIGYVGFANEDAQSLRVGWVNKQDSKKDPQIAEQLTIGGGDLNFYDISYDQSTSDDETKAAVDGVDETQEPARVVENYDVRGRPFYSVVRESQGPTWSPIYPNRAYPNFLQINATSPYYDADGKLLGILTSQVGLNQISTFLQQLNLSETGRIYLLERDGTLVATSKEDVPLLQKKDENDAGDRIKATTSEDGLIRSSAAFLLDEHDSFGAMAEEGEDLQAQFSLNGETQFLHVSPFKDRYGIDWLIVVVVPKAEFMGQITANTRNTIALCVAALAVAVGFCWLSARWVTGPMSNLVMASQAIAAGNLEQSVPKSRISEVEKLGIAFGSMSTQLKRSFDELEDRVRRRTAALNSEKERSDMLLRNVLPQEIVDRLSQFKPMEEEYFADRFEETTILFADIVGFTTLATKMDPLELVSLLNQIFSEFDSLSEQLGLEKIKTIGDAYMVVGGIPMPKANHAEAIAEMALAMQEFMKDFKGPSGEMLQVRVGINTGAAIAGVIGKTKFIYDLWGDTVNVASRMESHGEPGRIQVTESTYERLKDRYFHLLEAVITQPDAPMAELSALPSEELAQLMRWSQPEVEQASVQTLVELLEARALAQPDALAVQYGREQMSYADLNDSANAIAQKLRNEHGVAKGDLVAICADRSCGLIAGIWGALKAGAAFLPIDPA
ncbi:MAG: adenylate/guanylate cyclase domain-containing protein, partial [Cyanobacteria bacterium P01_F01_bin.153]